MRIMRMKKVKIITELVIVIIFSLLLANTSRAGIIPTTERNEIIPASNFEGWKSPSEMEGEPRVEVERQRNKNGWAETTKEFDADGNLIKEICKLYDNTGENLIRETIKEYDSEENLIKQTIKTYGINGKITREQCKEYNTYGGLVSRKETFYEYDSNGDLAKETFEEHVLCKGRGYLILAKEGVKEYTDGKLTKEHFKEYGTKGILIITIRDVTKEYDNNGNLVMEYRKEKWLD